MLSTGQWCLLIASGSGRQCSRRQDSVRIAFYPGFSWSRGHGNPGWRAHTRIHLIRSQGIPWHRQRIHVAASRQTWKKHSQHLRFRRTERQLREIFQDSREVTGTQFPSPCRKYRYQGLTGTLMEVWTDTSWSFTGVVVWISESVRHES